MNNVVIGKRIPIGMIAAGIFSGFVWYLKEFQGVEIPPDTAVQLSGAFVGIVQLFVVNSFGVTTKREPEPPDA